MFITAYSQNYFDNNSFDKSKKRIILTHPTTGTLSAIQYLIEHNIIDIKNAEYIGVYYEHENYNYQQSARLIKNEKYSNFSLHEVKGTLTENNIYTENQLTKQFKKIFNNSDAILFFGGADIQPSVYNEKTHITTVISEYNRHLFELSFLFHLTGGTQNSEYKPLLQSTPTYIINGFCLGLQTMNVAAGGTLVQDIPSQLYNQFYVEDILSSDKDIQHKNYNYSLSTDNDISYGWLHRIKYTQNSFIVENINRPKTELPLVYSSHHQSIKNLSSHYVAAAYSSDGKVIEAIQHKKFNNVYAWQFHPEKSDLYNKNEKIRFDPAARVQTSYYDVLTNNGLDFHYSIWKYFSDLVSKKE